MPTPRLLFSQHASSGLGQFSWPTRREDAAKTSAAATKESNERAQEAEDKIINGASAVRNAIDRLAGYTETFSFDTVLTFGPQASDHRPKFAGVIND